MAFSLWTWACDQLKPTTDQRMTKKNTLPQWVVHLSRNLRSGPIWAVSYILSCPPECNFQSETKIEPDLRLLEPVIQSGDTVQRIPFLTPVNWVEFDQMWKTVSFSTAKTNFILVHNYLNMSTLSSLRSNSWRERCDHLKLIYSHWQLRKMQC